MAGTKAGGLKAKQTNQKLYGENWYAEIGSKGGKTKSATKGFGYRWPCNCDLVPGTHVTANCAGKKGGVISKRGSKSHA